MIAEDFRPDGDRVVPLRLRLTHSGGEIRNGAMRIPAAGAGMADALQLCGERQSEAQWRVANMCRIAWSDEAGGWELTNNSHTLMCVCNGERVKVGAPVSIGVGDTLELGLLRFLVETEEAHEARGHAVHSEVGQGDRQMDETARPHAPETPVERFPPAFDLRDLAAHDGKYGSPESPTDALADPFGVLGIAGAQSRPTADVLAELLGEIPRSTASAAPVAHTPSPPPDRGGPTALLDDLHDEFVRVVRDPDQLAGRTDWEGFLAFGAEPAPTLDELRKQAELYPLLRDILLPREGIDRIIEDFEPLARSGLLDTENPEDVLNLFAPELARDARTSLPSLTRREHHELSPDSHIHIGSARVDKNDGDGEAPVR